VQNVHDLRTHLINTEGEKENPSCRERGNRETKDIQSEVYEILRTRKHEKEKGNISACVACLFFCEYSFHCCCCKY
jgi:hypothetical protein